MRRAAAKSLRSACSTIRAISAGTSFAATEMMPWPPTAISGSVSASSPDSTRKSFGTAPQISTIWPMLPDASLTPTIPATRGQAHQRRDVDVAAGPARHVVDDDGQPDFAGDRAVVLEEAFRGRLVVVRRDREDARCAPACFMRLRGVDDFLVS